MDNALKDIGKLRDIDIRAVDPQTLVDIRDVNINEQLNKDGRMRDYLQKIKNPYCYKQDKYVVKISFSDTQTTLSERLRELIVKVSNIHEV